MKFAPIFKSRLPFTTLTFSFNTSVAKMYLLRAGFRVKARKCRKADVSYFRESCFNLGASLDLVNMWEQSIKHFFLLPAWHNEQKMQKVRGRGETPNLGFLPTTWALERFIALVFGDNVKELLLSNCLTCSGIEIIEFISWFTVQGSAMKQKTRQMRIWDKKEPPA